MIFLINHTKQKDPPPKKKPTYLCVFGGGVLEDSMEVPRPLTALPLSSIPVCEGNVKKAVDHEAFYHRAGDSSLSGTQSSFCRLLAA